MGPRDSVDCPDTATKRTTTSTTRRAGALTAAVSLAMLTAAGAALAAPSSTAVPEALATPSLPEAPTFDAGASLTARAAAVALSTSRSADRGELPSIDDLAAAPEPEPEVIGKRYSTVALNVRTRPDADARAVTTLAVGDQIKVTDVKEDGWRQVLLKGETRWVKAEYLSRSKPKPTTSGSGGGVSTAACSNGSSISGVGANASAVHRAVCNRFPQITSYGGYRPGGGSHGSGRAVDIMISGSTGWDVANWLRANASQLGITEIIYSQRIWTTQRAGEGWRGMSDRGSTTANHYDHVHVTTR
jgi:uncharacterized protein YgiM (DUF1202 family)